MFILKELLLSSNLFQFLFILVLDVFAASKVTLQGRVCKKYIKNTQDSVLYNAIFFTFVALFLALIFPLGKFTLETFIYAFLMASGTVLFQVLYSVALTAGPVSLTVLIVNFSVLLPTVLSVVVFHEKLFYAQILGIIFLIVSMFLSNEKKEGEQKTSLRWLILSVISLIATGSTACLQKFFNYSESASLENSSTTFLFITYCVAAVLTFAVYFIRANTGNKEKSTYGFNKNVILYAMAIGALLAVFNYLFMFGIANIDGTFMFPTYYGMQSILMSIIGILLFKDPLSGKQKLGILCGVFCIALMNLKFGGAIRL